MTAKVKAKKPVAKGGGSASGATPPPARETAKRFLGEVNEGEEGTTRSFIDGQDGISIRLRGVVSTRCDALDAALGRGGIPQGRLTILTGADGSGKTTQALELVVAVQRQGGLAVYIDAEHKLDLSYAEQIGVNVEELVLSQPVTLEEIFRVKEKWIAKAAGWRELYGDVPVAIFMDSTNAAITKAMFEGEWGDQTVGSQSRFFSSKLPKMIGLAQRAGVTLVFIGQMRDKIGVMYGEKTHFSGGRALKHHATVVIKYTRIKKIMRAGSDAPVAILVKAYVDKNQVAPPFREAEMMIRFGYGIDQEAALIEVAIKLGVVEKKKKSAWLSFEGDQIGQGAEQAAGFLRKKPEWEDRIREAVRAEQKKKKEDDDAKA